MVKISYASWLGNDGLKAYLLTTHLPVQRNDEGDSWYVFTVDGGIIHETRILKTNGEEQTDFENSFSSLTSTITFRSAIDKPARAADSAQPKNTTEQWKGFQLELSSEEIEGSLIISFDQLIYLRGGVIYSDNCSNKDYINVDIVWTAYPSMIIVPNFLETIYMNKTIPISFLSSECMEFPTMLSLKVNYFKDNDNLGRVVSAMADYFKPTEF
jgi:hypothetical protein